MMPSGGQTVHQDLPDGASAHHETKDIFSDPWGQGSDGRSHCNSRGHLNTEGSFQSVGVGQRVRMLILIILLMNFETKIETL